MIEAFMDPKTWLFALFSALDNIPNSLTNQRQIIISSFGFTTLQTTLLGCVDGGIEIATIWIGVSIASRIPNSRAYVGTIFMIPNLLGVFLINLLPWENKIGLLFSEWLTGPSSDCTVLHPILSYITFRRWYHWLRLGIIMALERDSWTHQESYRECYLVVCLLYR
jgi:hypothetical protein